MSETVGAIITVTIDPHNTVLNASVSVEMVNGSHVEVLSNTISILNWLINRLERALSACELRLSLVTCGMRYLGED